MGRISGGFAFWGHRNIAFPTIFLQAREVSSARPPADSKFQSPLPSSSLQLSYPSPTLLWSPPRLASRKTK